MMGERPALSPRIPGRHKRLVDQGWTDALRHLHPDERIYTFWDYFPNAYSRDAGLRIAHILLSSEAAARLSKADVGKPVRGWSTRAITRRCGLN
jgi:exodeoxyribonuclease III